jgi:hypothetical protein
VPFLIQNPRQLRDGETDYIGARARIRARAWRTSDAVRLLLDIVVDFDRPEADSFALSTRRRPAFFQNPPQLRREMTGFGKSNGNDRRRGVEDGRRGTFIIEESGSLLLISVAMD